MTPQDKSDYSDTERDPFFGFSWSWEKVLRGATLLRWLCLAVGVLLILTYTQEIQQFPEGMTLGEGLAFYLLVLAYGLIGSIYLVCMTSIGGLFIRVFLWCFDKICAFKAKQAPEQEKRWIFEKDKAQLTQWWQFSCAVLGCLFLLPLGLNDPESLWRHSAVILLQGMLGFGYLSLSRLASFKASGLIVEGPKKTAIHQSSSAKYVILLMMGFVLIFVAPQQQLSRLTFSMAQLRKERALVHIKSPYDRILVRDGAKPEPSVLGAEFTQFREVDVLLRSIGERVTVRYKTNSGTVTKSLPKESIFIE